MGKTMHRYNYIFFSLFITILLGCISYTKPNSKKVFRDGANMLYGEITRDDLFSEYPAWYDNYVDYEPDSAVIRKIPTRINSTHFFISNLLFVLYQP